MHPKPKKRQTGRHESGELAWNIVGEIVRMAEGDDKLMLGRVPPRQRKTCRNLKQRHPFGMISRTLVHIMQGLVAIRSSADIWRTTLCLGRFDAYAEFAVPLSILEYRSK